MIKVVKQWFSDIANLRARHKLVVFMRDNANENKLLEIRYFFETKGTRNQFCTLQEQWQNGAVQSTMGSITMIAATVMVESGAGRVVLRLV